MVQPSHNFVLVNDFLKELGYTGDNLLIVPDPKDMSFAAFEMVNQRFEKVLSKDQLKIINTLYRNEIRKKHPDKAGQTEAAARFNNAKDLFDKAVESVEGQLYAAELTHERNRKKALLLYKESGGTGMSDKSVESVESNEDLAAAAARVAAAESVAAAAAAATAAAQAAAVAAATKAAATVGTTAAGGAAATKPAAASKTALRAVPPEIQSQDHAIQAMQTSITTFQSSVIARLNTEYAEMNERLTATEEDTERRLTEMEEKIDAMQGHKIDAMQGHTPNVSQQRSRRPQQKDSAFVKGMKNLYGDTARSQTVQSEEDSQSAKHSFYFVDVRQLQAALKNSKTNPVVLLETVGASISDATKASISDATKASISDATKASISEATKKYLPDIDETAITKYTRQKDGWSYSHFIQTPYQILATPDFNPDHIFEFLETKKSQFLHVFAAKPVEHIGQFWAQLTAYQHPITVLWYTEEPMDIANLVLDHADSARQLTLYNSWNVGDQ